jgi:hypothetical protein
MKKMAGLATVMFLFSCGLALAQSTSPTMPVSVDNFSRAETDVTMAAYAKEGALGKFLSARAPVSIDDQKVVRMNRDTLYSFGVFDLDAGPVTLTLPDTGKRLYDGASD